MMKSPPDELIAILGQTEQPKRYLEKIYLPTINAASIVFTNERIILWRSHAARLKEEYIDYKYEDIAEVVLERGVRHSSMKCTLKSGGEPLSLEDIPNIDAEEAYGIIREHISKHQMPSAVVA